MFALCSLQGDSQELMPPTPPPRRRAGGGGFSRIASGLKIAQAQAMAVAGFLPAPATTDNGAGALHPHGALTDLLPRMDDKHARCCLLNHRASFHGRG